MRLQLIRNATMKLYINGKVILTDPMLGKKDSMGSFGGFTRNPTVELTSDPFELINDVDFCLVSHMHPDHFDEWSSQHLPKHLKIICPPYDQQELIKKGFTNVEPINDILNIDGIEITRTPGQHGSGLILKMMGNVSGFVIKSQDNPTIYWVGDSILTNEVRETILLHKPNYVIAHSGGASFPFFNQIIMDHIETVNIFNILNPIKVIAIHMESLNHCKVSRNTLRNYATQHNITDDLIIPEDGQTCDLN